MLLVVCSFIYTFICCLETLILNILFNVGKLFFRHFFVVSNVSDEERLPIMTSKPTWTVMWQAEQGNDQEQVFPLSDKVVVLLDEAFTKVRSNNLACRASALQTTLGKVLSKTVLYFEHSSHGWQRSPEFDTPNRKRREHVACLEQVGLHVRRCETLCY